MKICRNGQNRWVILSRRYAFKFPAPTSWRALLYGLLNSMNEAAASDREHACPVLWRIPGGFLNIMPRCRPLNDSEWQDFAAHPAAFAGALEVERKPDSFGVLNGRIVAVDYGIPRERW